jgi:hypothetical protein
MLLVSKLVVFCLNVCKLPKEEEQTQWAIKNKSKKPLKWLPRLARRAMHKSVNRGILELPDCGEPDHRPKASSTKRKVEKRTRRDGIARLFIPRLAPNFLSSIP